MTVDAIKISEDSDSTLEALADDTDGLSFFLHEENRIADMNSALVAIHNRESGKKTNSLKLLVSPLWAFTQCYIIRLGFLDGNNGFIIARNVAHLTYLKNAKLLALQRTTVAGRNSG